LHHLRRRLTDRNRLGGRTAGSAFIFTEVRQINKRGSDHEGRASGLREILLFNRSIEWLARIALLGSLFAFVFAIVSIMNRFSEAVPPGVMEWWLRLTT
jgi:hypothetical protein